MIRFRSAALFAAAASTFASLLLLAGCGSGIYPYALDPKPPVPAPQITLTPTALSFAAVTGQTSAAQTITVGNSGAVTLNLASITLADTTNYTLTSNTCGPTLPTNTTCTLAITFNPKAVGPLNSSINFTDNSGNANNATQQVTLAGISTATNEPIASLSPQSINFSLIQTANASQVVTVTNIGTLPLLISAAAITGNADFTLTGTTCTASLAPTASCNYTITFTPTSTSSETATFTLTDNSNGTAGATQIVSITGTSAAATPAPVITINPTSLAFGNEAVLQLSAAQTVTLGNVGNATLNLTSIVLADTTNYTLDATACGSTLAPAATCKLSVAFDPQSAGTFNSAITVTDNTANVAGSQQTITLSGTGVAAAAPQAILTPASQTFPDTTAATTSASQTVTLSNPGTAALSITNIAYTGANFNVTTTCPTNGVLPANITCSFTITFSPSAAGPYSGSISVTDNANNVAGSIQTATYSGNGTASPSSSLTLTPVTANFPDTPVNATSSPITFTLTNTSTTGTASGISPSIVGGATAKAFVLATNNCSSTLAPLANCTMTVTFTPFVTGTYSANLSVAFTGTGSPVTAALNGNGVAPCSGNLFDPSSIAFPTTQVGKTSGTQTSTLTNCGTAPLTISNISFTGADTTYFTQSTNCGASVPAGGTCTVSATFSPAAARNYSASLVFTDNAGGTAGTQQTLPFTGTGTTSAISYQLLVFPETDSSVTPLYNFIKQATKTLDMTMYEMQDTTFTSDLVALCTAGIQVRVIFSSSEASANTTAYNAINAGGSNCHAVNSNSAFTNTHQKTITIDGYTSTPQTAIMSLNLQTQYYLTSRDFAMIENDPVDIAAIEATFEQDYSAAGTNSASEFNYQPGAGDDLIWSPTTAQADMLGLINNATKTLDIENEEMSASNIVSALESACTRGVTVHITMVQSSTSAPYSSYSSEWLALQSAGCSVHVYPDTPSSGPNAGLYIHAKAVVADSGLSTQSVYMGSINYSNASMTKNRELGLYITDPPSITTLESTLVSDYAGSKEYSSK